MRALTIPLTAALAAAILVAAAAVPAGAQAPGEAPMQGRIRVTADDCSRLVQHVPDADVTFRPGADNVVPADIEPYGQIAVPENFSIYIGVDTFNRLRVPSRPFAYEGYVDLGRVDWVDGQLFYNGQPLTGPDQDRLRGLCAQAMGSRR